MSDGAFYERRERSTFFSTGATTSPWDERLQHGGPPTALVARVIREEHPREDMRIARIAAEFFGPIPRDLVTVRTRIVRPGRRIELAEGVLESGGRDAVRVTVWRIATQPAGSIPPPAHRPAPPPPRPGPQPGISFFGLQGWGYGDAIEWRFSAGTFDGVGPAAVWTRVKLPLIAGEPAAALDRLVVVADAANGISGEVPFRDWLFVPMSLSLALARDPAGEWTFMEARSVLSDDGIGATDARYADERGFFGAGTQPLLVERRLRAP